MITGARRFWSRVPARVINMRCLSPPAPTTQPNLTLATLPPLRYAAGLVRRRRRRTRTVLCCDEKGPRWLHFLRVCVAGDPGGVSERGPGRPETVAVRPPDAGRGGVSFRR